MKPNLTDEQKRALFVAVVTFLLAVAAVFGYDYSVTQPRESRIVQIIEARLGVPGKASGVRAQSVTGSALYPVRFKQATVTDALYANGTFDVTGAQTNASTLDVTGNVTTSAVLKIGTFQRFGAGAAISVTNGITNLTPLATYQRLTSSGTVTVTTLITATAFTQGDAVKFINTNASGDIVFTNGTYLILPSAANLTLGPTDALELWFDGTKWITVSNSNN